MTEQVIEPISSLHAIGSFDSGVEMLDQWLYRRALANHSEGFARTFVLIEDGRVLGYYALSAGSISHADSLGSLRRNAPDPVPMVIMGRLAVAKDRQGAGLGSMLVRDAVVRTLQAAQLIGIRGILLHAKSDRASDFYRSLGFQPSPLAVRTMMIGLGKAVRGG